VSPRQPRDAALHHSDLGGQLLHRAHLALHRVDPVPKGRQPLQLSNRAIGVLHQTLEIGALGVESRDELLQLGQLLGGSAATQILEEGAHDSAPDGRRLVNEAAEKFAGAILVLRYGPGMGRDVSQVTRETDGHEDRCDRVRRPLLRPGCCVNAARLEFVTGFTAAAWRNRPRGPGRVMTSVRVAPTQARRMEPRGERRWVDRGSDPPASGQR
jgi:hypothetical protein